jgi:outer membrane protein TolC
MAGIATKADVLRVDALLASTRLVIASAHSLKSLAAQQLAVLMNVPVADWQVGESVRTAILPERPPLAQMVEEAHRRRLELRALAEADQSLALAAAATRVGKYPRLDAVGEYNIARPNPRYVFDASNRHTNWAIGGVLRWTIGDVFDKEASAHEVDANRRKVASQLEGAKRGLEMEVTSAYLDEEKARVALDTALRGLRSAQEAYRAALELYRVGRSKTTDLIAAEQELLSASLSEVNAAIDARLATVRLDHAAAHDVPAAH